MAHHKVHYDAAFEDLLRSRGWPFVAVDEAHRAFLGKGRLKNFDYVVYSSTGPNLLVDVKGRKFPDAGQGRSRTASRAWENWVTRDDLDSLADWQGVFGAGFRAALVFAYWLQGPPMRAPFEEVHFFRGRHYAFLAAPLDEYARQARCRSRSWSTVSVPTARFTRMTRDVAAML